jgi:hypothetical protein
MQRMSGALEASDGFEVHAPNPNSLFVEPAEYRDVALEHMQHAYAEYAALAPHASSVVC